MSLAASNLAIQQRGRAHHDKQRVSIDFELRSLMGAQRVLDGEVMQSEALLHHAQQRLIWLVQTDPDEAAIGGINTRLIEIDVCDPASSLVGGTVDHHAPSCLASLGVGPWPRRCFVSLAHANIALITAIVSGTGLCAHETGPS